MYIVYFKKENLCMPYRLYVNLTLIMVCVCVCVCVCVWCKWWGVGVGLAGNYPPVGFPLKTQKR